MAHYRTTKLSIHLSLLPLAFFCLWSRAAVCGEAQSDPRHFVGRAAALGFSAGLVELRGCAAVAPSLSAASMAELRAADSLDGFLAAVNNSVYFSGSKIGERAILIVPRAGVPELLRFRLRQFDWDLGGGFRTRIVDVLANAEVVQRAKDLGMTLGPFTSPGITPLVTFRRLGVPEEVPAPSPYIKTYTNAFVLEILGDALIRRTGLTWVYTESSCGLARQAVVDVGDEGSLN